MRKIAFAVLFPVCLIACSCHPKAIVFISPGEYRLKGGEGLEDFGISANSCFIASLTDYATYSKECDSYLDRMEASEEFGHWYICGGDYLMDISWKNCDFETMPSFFQGGVDEYRQILWSNKMESAHVTFVGSKTEESLFSARITYEDKSVGKSAEFIFMQVSE